LGDIGCRGLYVDTPGFVRAGQPEPESGFETEIPIIGRQAVSDDGQAIGPPAPDNQAGGRVEFQRVAEKLLKSDGAIAAVQLNAPALRIAPHPPAQAADARELAVRLHVNVTQFRARLDLETACFPIHHGQVRRQPGDIA
jgi:hypothetical protein